MKLIGIVVLVILVNVVWQVHMFNEVKKTSRKVIPKNQEEENIKTLSIHAVPIKEKTYQQSINRFEVNNWRKMHGLIKKSKKTWQKKGGLYGTKSDRR